MNNDKLYSHVYFIGIGGIGMSALARYFQAKGSSVEGYDLTPSPLTEALQREGISVHYTDDPEYLARCAFPLATTLVVYTPAVPDHLGELQYFRHEGYRVVKRSEALGAAVQDDRLLAVAGTHGKTTTSSLLAHILHNSKVKTNAFLGGISANFQSNLLLDSASPYVVVEADEYDRSFLHLYPYIAIVTSMDPDHLDIYGTPEGYREGFAQFIRQIKPGGTLIYKKGITSTPATQEAVKCYTYAMGAPADSSSDNIHFDEGRLFFDWHFPERGIEFKNLELGVPITINVENATAALTAACLLGVSETELRSALASFRGIHRRFERLLDTPSRVLMDDYAHHPEELRASIASVRALYPHDKITGIFQPHLYSRTQDFYPEFAEVLSELDEVILLPIYPAREEPIPGVSSSLILDKVSIAEKSLIPREELVERLRERENLNRVILTLGAGNIDRIVAPLRDMLLERN